MKLYQLTVETKVATNLIINSFTKTVLEKCPSLPRAQGNIFKYLVLYKKLSETHEIDIKQREGANLHTWDNFCHFSKELLATDNGLLQLQYTHYSFFLF